MANKCLKFSLFVLNLKIVITLTILSSSFIICSHLTFQSSPKSLGLFEPNWTGMFMYMNITHVWAFGADWITNTHTGLECSCTWINYTCLSFWCWLDKQYPYWTGMFMYMNITHIWAFGADWITNTHTGLECSYTWTLHMFELLVLTG